jgi:hypothetical protein
MKHLEWSALDYLGRKCMHKKRPCPTKRKTLRSENDVALLPNSERSIAAESTSEMENKAMRRKNESGDPSGKCKRRRPQRCKQVAYSSDERSQLERRKE